MLKFEEAHLLAKTHKHYGNSTQPLTFLRSQKIPMFHQFHQFVTILVWLVVWNMNFTFHNIWDSPSHWLSYFSRWLKPPTSCSWHRKHPSFSPLGRWSLGPFYQSFDISQKKSMCCWKISPFYPYFLLSIPKLYEAPEDSPVLVMSQWEHIYIYHLVI